MQIERLRADTPGTAHVIHLNNAGAGLMPQSVLDAMIGHLHREAEIGGYEARTEAAKRLEAVYASAAALVNGAPDEIAMMDNATRAFDTAFQSLPLRDGDIILTSTTEYGSNYLMYLRQARDLNIEVRVVPEAERGEMSLDALESMLREPRVRAVCASHVPTQSGLVQPAVEIGKLTQAVGCFYLLDATQTVGQMPIDVQAIGCDALATTGRKYLRGPRATGFLWVKRERLAGLHPPLPDLQSALWTGPESYDLVPTARRFEIWEQNFAGLLGMGAAIDYARAVGMPEIWARIQIIAARLRGDLASIRGVEVHDRGAQTCGIVSFTVEGIDAGGVRDALAAQPKRINVSTSTKASAMLDFPARGLTQTVRASVHYYNTEDELAQTVAAVEALARSCR